MSTTAPNTAPGTQETTAPGTRHPSTIGELATWISEKTENKYTIDDAGKIWEVGRYKNCPASFQALISGACKGVTISESVETLVTGYLSCFPLVAEVADGDDIHDAYTKYRPGSCMAKDCARRLREFWAVNPDKVASVYVRKGGHPLLESHVNCLAYCGTETVFLGRPYANGYCVGTKNHIIRTIADAARAHFGVESVKTMFDQDIPGLGTSGKVTLRGFEYHGENMPWIDELQFAGMESNGKIKLSTHYFEGAVDCHNTGGTSLEPEREVMAHCCHCGGEIYADDDDYRTTDYGDAYHDECYNDCMTYSDYDEEDYPNDEVTEKTLILENGDIRTYTISRQTLRDDFTVYAAELGTHEADYIYNNRVVYTDDGYALDVDECHDCDVTREDMGDDTDDSTWVICQGTEKAYPLSRMTWDSVGECWHSDTYLAKLAENRAKLAENRAKLAVLGVTGDWESESDDFFVFRVPGTNFGYGVQLERNPSESYLCCILWHDNHDGKTTRSPFRQRNAMLTAKSMAECSRMLGRLVSYYVGAGAWETVKTAPGDVKWEITRNAIAYAKGEELPH